MTDNANSDTSIRKDQRGRRGGRLEKIIVDEVLTRQIAIMLATGHTFTSIGEELRMSRITVSKIAARQDVKDILRDIGESSVLKAKNVIRVETSKLVHKIMKVLNQKLDEGDLDAVKVTLKVLGLNDEPILQNQDSNITVVLPGAEQPKISHQPFIEVPNETSEPSDTGFDPQL